MSDRATILRSVIFKPYRDGATGPDAFDCIGLVQFLSRALYGVEVPSDPAGIRAARRTYFRTASPSDGSIVILRAQSNHVGLWLSPECGIIHAIEGPGVVFQQPNALYFAGLGSPRYFARHDQTRPADPSR